MAFPVEHGLQWVKLQLAAALDVSAMTHEMFQVNGYMLHGGWKINPQICGILGGKTWYIYIILPLFQWYTIITYVG
jgi:hypothetical protein